MLDNMLYITIKICLVIVTISVTALASMAILGFTHHIYQEEFKKGKKK